MKKYKSVRIPLEAWDNLNKKKAKMESTIKEVTKKQKNIKFANFLRFVSSKPTDYVYPDEIVDYFCRVRKKKGGFLI